MNSELFKALADLEKNQGIAVDTMLAKIEEALIRACQKEFAGKNLAGQNSEPEIEVVVDKEKGDIKAYLVKTVVEEIDDPVTQIKLADAKEHNKRISVGKQIKTEIKTKNLHRISAKAARDVIIQGIREAEKENARKELENRKEELVSCTVKGRDKETGDIELLTGAGTIILPFGEQIPDEELHIGDDIRVYVRRVMHKDGRVDVRVSRSDSSFVKCLMKLEVPEIDSGIITIKSIAREAGSRTKVAVYSSDESVDAVGSCVGPRSMRINAVNAELRGEKIDIIEYSEDLAQFISASLAPATVKNVEMIEERSAKVTVAADQLSLAIGRVGQNARLAAKLTGAKIDIKAE